jgi:2-iminobutanoate/2-iminopropanoate deaminase
MASDKRTVQSAGAPKALGPYAQAIVANGFVFCAGQIGLDAGGNLVAGGVAEQTHQVLKNLRAVLKEAGSDLDRAVKTTVFVKNMNDFAAMNEVYAQYFGAQPPARSTVEVARLPRDVLVEIEVVATA